MNSILKFFIALLLILSTWGIPHQLGAYQENPKVKGVTVKGQVTFKGKVPMIQALTVNRDAKFCGKTMPDESLLVDLNSKGISNIVVNIKKITSGKALPAKSPVPINNQECRFQPPVSLGMQDSPLEIASADPVLHNTHILQNEDTFLNVALPPGGRTIRKKLSQTGHLDVRCDAHQFMQASIHVFDHPYYTNTDNTGHFELTLVPPGKYLLQFWHQTLGTKELSITVKKSTPLSVKISYP